jgi:peptidase MA superfamily protein
MTIIQRAFLLAAAVLSGTPILAQDEVGRREKEKIQLNWSSTDSKNYSFQYEKVIPAGTVKQIGEALEDALAQYVLVFGAKPPEKLKVKFLDSENTYEQEGGDPSHPGHYRRPYLVIRQMPFYDLLPTVYHEAFHQYLDMYMGNEVEIPTWFNEGMAMYYEGMQKNKATKKLDYKLIDNRKLRVLKDAIFTRSALPLEKLIDASHQEFHDKEKESLHYNQSFSVIYFLMQGMGGKPVMAYAGELKKSKDIKAANEKILGKDRKNLKSFEAHWKDYVSKATIVEPKNT